MTLIRDLIDIPEQVQEGDFVLKLTQGVAPEEAQRTVRQYVVTPELVENFDEALGLIAASVADGVSRATYLHGSFGSGKSHFMAILHLLLQDNPAARGKVELHPIIVKWEKKLSGKRFLLVPLHFLTAKSMDAAILGGYASHVQREHPDAPLPAIFLADEILKKELPPMRERLGDEAFLAGLNQVAGADQGWGEFGITWELSRLEEALAAAADTPIRNDLTAAYIGAYRQATSQEARNVGEGFINLDDGLAAISAHAKSLGYDAVILFLDELILWLASNIGDLDFVQRESQKLTKLVEATNAARPVPLVSFVARQRDLRELVGDHIAGAELRSFADNLELQKGRFGQITLEDRNLPVIASKRLLTPVNEAAAIKLQSAIGTALAGRDDVLQRLLTNDADVALFRMVYPFSPALVQALIAVSEALQRERTALKVMLQLLVDRRDDLELGDLIPVGDLWDVVAARDEPFSSELRQAFDTAKRLYRSKLRPMLLGQHELTEETPHSEARWKGFKGDDRIIKTILMAALVERVEAFRNLDASRLVALNWGSVVSPIAGRETQIVAAKLRTWNALVGELKVGDDPTNPIVSVALVNIDTEEIIQRGIETFDNPGTRRKVLRQFVTSDLGNRLGDDFFGTFQYQWRGTDREIDVVFGNIRDTDEVPDARLKSMSDRPKIVIDLPFDDHGRSPEDDLDRLDQYSAHNTPTLTVCWVPSFLNTQGLSALRTFVAIDELLKGDRYEQQTSHLSPTQRLEAKPILESRRSQLREQLRIAVLAAYGVISDTHPLIDPTNSLSDHLRSLDPSLTVRPTTEPTMAGAFDQISDQLLTSQYPGHPRFEEKVTAPQRKTTWAEVSRALGVPDGRINVEQKYRNPLRNVANALELGTMHESHFLLSRAWSTRLDRFLDLAKREQRHITVAELRALIDNADGGPRGLPSEIADLVILTVAAQTDHAVVRSGHPVVADGGSTLPTDAVLEPQRLPDEKTWKVAGTRAGAIFGEASSLMVSAPEAARLADVVKSKAASWSTGAARLVDHLRVAIEEVGLGDLPDNRLRTAEAAYDLVTALQTAGGSHVVIEVLSQAKIPTSESALGRSLTTASEVTEALAQTNWELLRGAGFVVLGPLREVISKDELVERFDPVRRSLEQRATRIVTGSALVPTQPIVTTRTIRSQVDLEAITLELQEAIQHGPIELNWRLIED